MAATSPPPLPHGAWHARAFAGDTHASLLLPHQLLITRAEALRHGIVHLAMVEVSMPADDNDDAALLESSTSTHPRNGVVLLECVVDWNQMERSNGCDCVQLSGWVLERLGLREGGAVALRHVVQESHEECQSVELSVVSKYPVTVSHTSSSKQPSTVYGDVASSVSSSAALKCLPESVRDGKIHLEHALQRQLRASGYLVSSSQCALKEGHLVAAQLLQETYIFRVESAQYTSTKGSNLNVQVRVLGWSTSDSSREGQPASQSQDRSTEQQNGNEERDTTMATLPLEDRLWRAGFVGYDAFFHDVLLNIALIVKGTPPSLSISGIKQQQQRQRIGSHGLLLSGVHGVGKSLALLVLQSEVALFRIPVKRIDGMSLLMESESTKLSSTYEFLTQQVAGAFPDFESLSQQKKSSSSRCTGVLLIDDIDVLFQTPSGEASDESDAGEMLTPLGSSLLRLLDAISELSQRICIVGTTSNADVSIPSAAKRAERFGKTIEMIVPTEAMRSEILARHLSVLPLSGAATSPEDQPASPPSIARKMASRLAALTGGYVAKDLVRICRNSLVQANKAALKKAQPDENEKSMILSLTWEDLLAAQQLVKPSQLRELNVASPGAGGDGINMGKDSAFAGYSTLRKQLVDSITWKFSPSAAMNRLGVANASGILLHGPSGCGKSLLVRTLVAHARVNFVSVKSSEIMSKYFGDSEKAVRELFARARAASPCILFFDEFDAIAHKRSFGGDGNSGDGGDSVYARILSTFLNEMDGVGAIRNTSSSPSGAETRTGEILVIAATNRVDALDAALVRPGRIDKTIEIGFPTEVDKEEILAHYTRKMPLASDVNISSLATRQTGNRPFTGADLAAVCKDAALRALRENMNAEAISMHHFDQAWHSRVSNAI